MESSIIASVDKNMLRPWLWGAGEVNLGVSRDICSGSVPASGSENGDLPSPSSSMARLTSGGGGGGIALGATGMRGRGGEGAAGLRSFSSVPQWRAGLAIVGAGATGESPALVASSISSISPRRRL
jgi:hypothetical protein